MSVPGGLSGLYLFYIPWDVILWIHLYTDNQIQVYANVFLLLFWTLRILCCKYYTAIWFHCRFNRSDLNLSFILVAASFRTDFLYPLCWKLFFISLIFLSKSSVFWQIRFNLQNWFWHSIHIRNMKSRIVILKL